MDINWYNTKVRQTISDKLVECSKNRAEAMKEFEKTSLRLANEMDILTYKQYLELKDKASYLHKEIEMLSVEIDTWDKAREICLNLADEMIVKCLQCGHEFELQGASRDTLGWCTTCPKCGGSFDIDIEDCLDNEEE